jgi:acetyltransferase-like isoleucine patch superfamily enzyme
MKIRDVRLPIRQILTVGLLPSPLKKLYYRGKGYRIGRGVRLGPGSVIDVSGPCEIGDETSFGALSIVSCESLRVGKRTQIRSLTILLVPHVTIGDDVIISETAIIRAQQPFPDSRLEIGDRAHIFPYAILDPSRLLRIGPETAVGFASYVFTHGAYKDKLAGYPVTYGDVIIGKAVWLPCRIFVMPGVNLGDDVVVGSGSVVTKSFPAGSFVLGSPAKLLKTREEFVASVTREEQLAILQQILEEFAIYVEHFGGVQASVSGSVIAGPADAGQGEPVPAGGRRCAVLQLADGGERSEIVLCDQLVLSGEPPPERIYLVHEELDAATRGELDRRLIPWFSYEGHCCSAHLNETALVLREYLTRYGIMLARP